MPNQSFPARPHTHNPQALCNTNKLFSSNQYSKPNQYAKSPQALCNEPITVYGDGSQTRSFQYVADLIAGLVKVMEGPETGPFNVGNPGE